MTETYKYKSIIVAKYIISRAIEDRIIINMTKLQKLLYASYGVYLAVKNQRLTNEQPKAWPYGPVFPTTRKKLLSFDFDSADYDISKDPECVEIRNDSEIKSLMDVVFKSFGQLTEWSHMNGSPWHKTTLEIGFEWNNVIPDLYIYEYFSNYIKQ